LSACRLCISRLLRTPASGDAARCRAGGGAASRYVPTARRTLGSLARASSGSCRSGSDTAEEVTDLRRLVRGRGEQIADGVCVDQPSDVPTAADRESRPHELASAAPDRRPRGGSIVCLRLRNRSLPAGGDPLPDVVRFERSGTPNLEVVHWQRPIRRTGPQRRRLRPSDALSDTHHPTSTIAVACRPD
jgi:hypothetical protein